MNTKVLLTITLVLFSVLIVYIFKKVSFHNNIDKHLDYFNVEVAHSDSVDIIFSFLNTAYKREFEAFKLYKQYNNAFWISSYLRSFQDLENQVNHSLDTARVDIIYGSRNTFEEVLKLSTYLGQNRVNLFGNKDIHEIKVILVSSNWHLKRVKMIAEHLLADYKLSYYAVNNNGTDLHNLKQYKSEYFDISIDWLRCMIWKISFGNITIKANKALI